MGENLLSGELECSYLICGEVIKEHNKLRAYEAVHSCTQPKNYVPTDLEGQSYIVNLGDNCHCMT